MEYEYSFKVKSLNPYIEYCLLNDYLLEKKVQEIRIIYRNSNKTIARITKQGNKIFLDFKEDKLSDEDLNQRKESKALEITDMSAVKSILDFIGYKEDNTLKRERLIYRHNKVKFEIDSYQEPEKCLVVSLEGDKKEVDEVYKEIKLLGI